MVRNRCAGGYAAAGCGGHQQGPGSGAGNRRRPAKLDVAGCEPKSAPPAAFADIIRSDVAVWAKVVKEAGITAD
jgi:hypothetical protein